MSALDLAHAQFRNYVNEKEVRSKGEKMENKWGYLLHHFFPKHFSPKRFPEFLAFPTHINSLKTERIVSVAADGRIAIYFNPAVTTQSFNASTPSSKTAFNTWLAYNGAESVVSGATTGCVDITTNLFRPIGTDYWPNYSAGFNNSSSYRRLRILSSYIEIEYIGKPLETGGLLKVGLTTLKYGNIDAVSTTSFQNMPVYGSFKVGEKLLLMYRHLDELAYTMGPYDSNSISFPAYFIFGEGIPLGGSFKVSVVRTFEGIPGANIKELVNPLRIEHMGVGALDIKSKYGVFNIPPVLNANTHDEYYRYYFGSYLKRL
ncbi:MAG: hypothetical protein RIR01_1608 [Bacteroidota bacterium]|jgi:hypothetical protein